MATTSQKMILVTEDSSEPVSDDRLDWRADVRDQVLCLNSGRADSSSEDGRSGQEDTPEVGPSVKRAETERMSRADG